MSHNESRHVHHARSPFRTLSLVVVFLLLAAVVQIIPPHGHAQQLLANGQVWGQRERSGEYWGVDAYMDTPNPSIANGEWAGGPTAVSNLTSKFAESGPTKACEIDCGLYPYGSWGNIDTGAGDEVVATSIRLGAGSTYRYRTYYTSLDRWQALFCSGSPISCSVVISSDVGALPDRLPYVVSGGESSGLGVRWGTITTSYATYVPFNSNTYYSWCYTSDINNVGGTLSACNSDNYSWSASH